MNYQMKIEDKLSTTYIVYKTTNKINGKFYIGSHYGSHDVINDTYLGSGLTFKEAVEKYGRQNFIREILFECSTLEDMIRVEEEQIDYHFNNPLCYNLSRRSCGGDLGEFIIKPILQIDSTGSPIRRYESRLEAIREVPYSVKCHNVNSWLTKKDCGNEKLVAGNFIWVYEEDFDKIIPERFQKSLDRLKNIKPDLSHKNNQIFLVMMDIHLHENNIDLIKSIFNQAIKYCIENKIQYILQGGDIFHSRKSLSQKVLIAFKEILDTIYNNGLIMYCIPGNHDKTSLDDEFSWLSTYKHSPGFRLFEKENSITHLHGYYDIHMLPYFEEHGSYLSRLQNIVDNLNPYKKHILITHISINGVKNNDGSEVDNDLKPDLFKSFDKVLVAHYHNASKVKDNIFYTGSCYQANWGEDEHKGFTVINNIGETLFVKTTYPKYVKYKLHPKEITVKVFDSLVNENIIDNVKVILTGTDAEIDAIDQMKYKLSGLKLEKKVNTVIKEEIDKRVDKFDNLTLQKQFETFCTKNGLDQVTGQKYLDKVL